MMYSDKTLFFLSMAGLESGFQVQVPAIQKFGFQAGHIKGSLSYTCEIDTLPHTIITLV
jgi:hypothetical protein